MFSVDNDITTKVAIHIAWAIIFKDLDSMQKLIMTIAQINSMQKLIKFNIIFLINPNARVLFICTKLRMKLLKQ